MDMSKIKKFLGVANIGCNMILQQGRIQGGRAPPEIRNHTSIKADATAIFPQSHAWERIFARL